MATSQTEDQPRKLIDRRRLVEMKMQEDEALFNNIMKAIEPCFQLVGSRPADSPQKGAPEEPDPKQLSNMKSVDGKKTPKSSSVKRKPYSLPTSSTRSSADDGVGQTKQGEKPEAVPSGADRTVRVSVIKHASAVINPASDQKTHSESIQTAPTETIPHLDNRLAQLCAAGLCVRIAPWSHRCGDQAACPNGLSCVLPHGF